MGAFILFYSRTDTTRAIARAIAEQTGAGLGEIRCTRYRPGLWRYVAAGRDALRRRVVRIDADVVPQGSELLILCGPVWAGRLSVPLRSWLAEGHDIPPRCGLLLTSGGETRADRAFDDAADLIGRPLTARVQISQQQHSIRAKINSIASFCEGLGLKFPGADRPTFGQPRSIHQAA